MAETETMFDLTNIIDGRGRLKMPSNDAEWAVIEGLPPEKHRQFETLVETFKDFEDKEAALKERTRLVPIALSNLSEAEKHQARTVKQVSPLQAFRAQQAAEAKQRGVAPPKYAAAIDTEESEAAKEAAQAVTLAREALYTAQAEVASARAALKTARTRRGEALAAWLGFLSPLQNARHYIKSQIEERKAAIGRPAKTPARQIPSVLDAHLSYGPGGNPAIRSTRQGQRGAYPASARGRLVTPRG